MGFFVLVALREFTLSEVATMTRSAAARLLGLHDRGHLAPGAIADIAVYNPQGCGMSVRMPDAFANQARTDYRAMFADADLVFKNGRLVVKDGEVITRPTGNAQTIQPHFDPRIEGDIQNHFDRFYSLKLNNFKIDDVAFNETDSQRFRNVDVNQPAN